MFVRILSNGFHRIGVAAVMISCSAGLAPDSPSPESVRADYLEAISSLQRKLDHCRGAGVMATFKVPKGSTSPVVDVKRTWVRFSLAGDRGKVVTTPLESVKSDVRDNRGANLATIKAEYDSSPRSVMAYNPDYSFTLQRTKSDWIVESLKAGDKSGRKAVLYGAGHVAQAAIMAYRTPISVFFGFKTFHLDRVKSLEDPTGPRLRLDFSVPLGPIAPTSAFQITSGWFVVSPADGWIVHEYGVIRTWRGLGHDTEVGHVRYRPGSDGQPQPIETDHRIYLGKFTSDPAATDPGIVPTSGETFQFAESRFGADPEHDFTLSAFGLPEFGQTTAQATSARSFPWWTVWASVGFACLAVGVRRSTWRRRSSSVSNAD